MNLVDRYVAAVARRLPRSRRSDISRELKSTLLDAVETRFGQAATEADRAKVLLEFGRPETVAASYWPASQYLIGPEWYEPFIKVLHVHLVALVAIVAAGLVTLIFAPPGGSIAGAISGVIGNAVQIGVFAFAVIVLIFHLLERGEVRRPAASGEWDPHDLPDVDEDESVGRAESIVTIIATLAGLVVLYRFKDYVGIPIGNSLLLNDILLDNLPWITALAALTVAQYALLLQHGRWHWYTRCSKIGVDLFGVLIAWRIGAAIAAQRGVMEGAGLAPGLVTVIVQIAYAAPFVAIAAAVLGAPWGKLSPRRIFRNAVV